MGQTNLWGDKMALKVGFIGLGHMGRGMAENVLKKGFDTTVFDLRREPVEALKQIGATAARSPREVGERCEIIIIIVLDDSQVEEVVLGKEGVLAGAKPGSVIVVMSTVSAKVCQRISQIAAQKGVGLIDAPVTGGPTGASAGTLSMLAGGDIRLVEKCRPVLLAMGSHIFHFGEVGQAQVVKAAKSLISTTQYVAICEAVAIVNRAGVNTESFFEMVRASPADCRPLHDKNWYVWWKRKFDEPETTRVNVKDSNLALDTAREFGLELEHLEAMARLDYVKVVNSVPPSAVKDYVQR